MGLSVPFKASPFGLLFVIIVLFIYIFFYLVNIYIFIELPNKV